MHLSGDQVIDLAVTFQYAIHGDQRGIEDYAALAFPQALPDDDIDVSGFVFEGQEDGAVGGHGPLPHGDQATGAGVGAVFEL